jgi:ADP-ribose pyrophosphatase
MARQDATEPLETLHEGKWLRLLRRGRWEYAERSHGGEGLAVIIVAATPDDDLLFVEQFRVPLGAPTIEFPAGLVADSHDTDTIEEAARRELVEETGWEASKVEVLLTGPTSAGMTNERIAFARASGLSKVGSGGGVGTEDIVVHAVPRGEAAAWLMRKGAQGCELDLKLWAGLWLIDRDPDGTPVTP